MRLSPLVIQGLWEFKSPLLQLPFVTEDHLRYFVTKKRHIRSLQQFAQLPAEESRALLRNFSDYEYENVMRVLGNMPLIDFSIRCEGKIKEFMQFLQIIKKINTHISVVDDEHSNVVTAGAIVTVTVTLERRSMKELFGDTLATEKPSIKYEF
jgi:translocation protein SEC63